ncbi:MAG: diguanylate cyclase [Burkholderiales bacterium]|nr:diguanylate cyclase [Burkholderiales bacterium]
MRTPTLRRLADVVFTTDAKQRLRITRSLLATSVYVICVALMGYACWAGFMDIGDVQVFTVLIVINALVWYAALRSGFNLRFEDPALTLPQILASLTLIVGAYSITGPIHGSTMMLLTLVMVFGIFNLKARASKIAAAYTVTLMGLAMVYKMRTDPVYYPLKLEVAHFVLTASIVPTISMLAAQLSSLRAKLQAQKDELAQAVTRIQILATRDELTGLCNRRHMRDVLNQHQQRLGRSGFHPFCLAILDLDHFKRVNDTHGHGVGDEVLRHFAEQAHAALREVDVLARWGGEEFLLLLVNTTPDLAQLGIERIRDKLSKSPLVLDQLILPVTFSAGLTGYSNGEPLDTCIERADRALYEAKKNGRNRTEIAVEQAHLHAPPVDATATAAAHDQSAA